MSLRIVVLLLVCLSAYAAVPPNIIYILADDFGLPDIGCYGSVYKTPNLDTLAAGGTLMAAATAGALAQPGHAPGELLTTLARHGAITDILKDDQP